MPPHPSLKRRSGRPTQAESRRLDELIIAQGRKSFIERGFGATTMERIAQDAGVTRRSVMQRFACKDDLLVAVAEQDTRSFAAELGALEIGEAAPLEDLKAMCRKLLDRGTDAKGSALIAVYLGEAGRLPQLAGIMIDFNNRISAEIQRMIFRVQTFGVFQRYSARTVATAVISLMMSNPRLRCMLFDRQFRNPHDVDLYFSEVWALLLMMA